VYIINKNIPHVQSCFRVLHIAAIEVACQIFFIQVNFVIVWQKRKDALQGIFFAF
jgi:hypothetical protein